jgi:3-dehydroquinate dehydratase
VQPFNSQEEIAKLRKEMEELKLLLLAAKRYDEQMGEPDCEMDDKVALIKKIAKLVGVDMKDVFGGN